MKTGAKLKLIWGGGHKKRKPSIGGV